MRVVQITELVGGIDLREISGLTNKSYSYNSEFNNDSNADANIMPAPINKIIKDVEELCKACIKSKYMRIIKLKKITPTIKRL